MMSLRGKLTWQITALIFGSVLIGLAALWGLNGLNQDFGVALNGYQRLRNLYEVGAHVEAARTLLSVAHPEVDRARLELGRAREKFDIDFPPAPGLDETERNLLKSLRDALDAAIRSGASPDELETSLVNGILGPLIALDVHTRQTIETAQLRATEKRKLTMMWMAGLSLGVALLALGIGAAQYRSVMTPLRILQSGVQRVAAGRFTERLAVSGSREFAQLAQNFNLMAGELDELYRDLQQKVEAKSKELVRNERLASVGFLAAGVAHEINNPLSIITAHAELSSQQLKQNNGAATQDIARSLEVIREEAFRCKAIVEKLLSLAKSPRETVAPFSLAALAREVVESVKALPDYKDRTIEIKVGAGADIVSARAGEIKQVMLNLLFNAMEATDAGSTVKVGINENDNGVELSVCDNGKGMSEQVLDRIFEPFFTDPRGKAAPTGDGPRGTGLGLSITHAIVRRYGGEIRAFSNGAGKGSRFVVTFPAAVAAPKELLI